MAKYKRSAEDIKRIKENDDPVISVGPIYMSLKRFNFALYNNLHKAFLSWSQSPQKIARGNELYTDDNGISVQSVNGFYHSLICNAPLGLPNGFPAIYSFAGKQDFNGQRVAVPSRGNTRAVWAYKFAMSIMPTILIFHHFGDESIISKDLLSNPEQWSSLSFDGEPSDNEEFFLKHAKVMAPYAFKSKVMKKDSEYVSLYGNYPYSFSIERDLETGLMPDGTKNQTNTQYINMVEEYCERANILILDKGYEL